MTDTLDRAPCAGACLPGRFATDFVGLDTRYATRGAATRRVYLDSAATTLMMGTAQAFGREFLVHQANPHTSAHFAAQVASESLAWAGDVVLDFLGAPRDEYVALFMGAGATACANRLAFALRRGRPQRPLALVSAMEHHSNDLPHRAHGEVLHVGLEPTAQGPGAVSLHALETLLRARPGEVNYVAVTAASNVTGLVNPIHDIAELAHRHGALVVVDGAQSTAHAQMRLSGPDRARDIDAYFFSGHKVYAPGSPGVLVIKRALLHGVAPLELGGGIVEDVTASSYRLLDSPAAQIAGTPNVLGAVTLAAALEGLRQVGMEAIVAHERALAQHMIARLSAIPGLEIYGPTDLDAHPRVGCIGFNLAHVEHALAATLLNDEFNVAVRNGCFCAHPYARSLLGDAWQAFDTRGMDDLELERYVAVRRGMVRASVGAYTTIADIDALADGLREIGERVDDLRRGYIVDATGARSRVARADMPNFQPALVLSTLLRDRGVLA